MVYVGNQFYLPVEKSSVIAEYGNVYRTRQVSIGTNRYFPRDFTAPSFSAGYRPFASIHEGYWMPDFNQFNDLPCVVKATRPGLISNAGIYSESYHLSKWGALEPGTFSASTYHFDVGRPYFNESSRSYARYIYADSDYGRWIGWSSSKQYLSEDRIPESPNAIYGPWLYMPTARTIIARPYALLIFKNLSTANVQAYCSSSGSGYSNSDSSGNWFGFCIFISNSSGDNGTYNSSNQIEVSPVGFSVVSTDGEWKGLRPSRYTILGDYTYNGDHYVVASVVRNIVSYGSAVKRVSSPFFNCGMAYNTIDSGDTVRIEPLPIRILELGCEYALVQ